MRICILSRPDLFPVHHGAAARIVRTAEAMARAGAHVCVVTEDRDRYWRLGVGRAGSAGEGAVRWEEVPFGPRFRAAEEWPILRAQARAEALCRLAGYPEEEFLLYRPLFDPAWWARALYVGRREQITSWQAEFPGFALPALIARSLLALPGRGRSPGRLVLSAHNVEFDRLSRMTDLSPARLARIRRIEVAVMRAADDVLALSADDRERMIAAGVPPEKIRLIPHGVGLRDYAVPRADLRRRYGLSAGPILFFHGTLHYAPNAEAVRFLLRRLMPALPAPASLLIAGMSPPLELLTPDLAGRVRFAGPVDDLPAHILAADLCLCPITSGGGTRMKLMEYFAAGRAVVSTPFGAEGLPARHDREIVHADPDGFARATLDLLGDPARRSRIGSAARAFAAGYDWSEIGAAILDVHRGQGRDFAPRPPREAHLPRRRPSKPLTLLLLINRGCNLRCSFCDLWDRPEEMPLDRALPLLREAAAIGTETLVITGGEPLLHPGLPAIVREAKRLGLAVNITTNGTLLLREIPASHAAPARPGDPRPTFLQALRDAGVDSLSLSLDGLDATHDQLRGQPRARARTLAALKEILRHPRPAASVYFVATAQNVRELVPVWEEVRALGAGFDFWPVNLDPHMQIAGKPEELLLLRPEDQQAWRDAVAHIAARDPEIAARRAYYEEGLRYHEGLRDGASPAPARCLGLIDQYGVTYRGDLLPCCVWGGDGLKVGNVFQTPLRQLWDSPEVQRARERMYRDGCTAGCYNHSLYEFGISTGEPHRLPARPAR